MIRVAVQILTYFYVGLGIGLSISTFVDMKQVVVGYGQMAPFTSPTNNMALIHIGPTSPVELNLLAGGPDEVVTFKDENMNHDDASVADEFAKHVRVLCWVMTYEKNHKTRAEHVKATWGKRCNKLLFVSEAHDPDLPILKLNVSSGRHHLTAKTMQAFDFVYKNYINHYDWFMKADDDTYLTVENLRYLLSAYSIAEPVFFGHHYTINVKQGFFSGGGGYVLSREALSRYGKRSEGLCAEDGGPEDGIFGICMERLGVRTGDSRDALGRSRFHPFTADKHLGGGYPKWYFKYDKYNATHGGEHISDYAITFHYMSVDSMYAMEYFVYHLRPFGISNEEQNLNPQHALVRRKE